ncbi:flagellar protein export ATPase FliI [Oceaniovalibus guishaninsula JLT2003]|uniref:Flagellar protein export ATPase FliI n=1 Tax=Oceaniovalibus guishaninsula JLT2003 TaxID=1231392 RepID=K2GM24_9RHOB|nr:FliI/YscN family ATPase [Oceaniovalibus guishaninsula]EKE43781.1 flagellar protein export ATPase FliI [Oceaniovalibus guishaninsula JLT2003]
MSSAGLEQLRAVVLSAPSSRPVGRISAIAPGRVTVQGLNRVAAIGDLVRIMTPDAAMLGEVTALTAAGADVSPDGSPDGLRIGMRAVWLGPATISPHDCWVGRVVDPYGNSIDGRALLPGTQARRLAAAPPDPVCRRALGGRLSTGLCAFNTLLPLVRGQRIGLFAGSGVGKSTLLAALAQRVEADVVVIAMVGERGREVREFIDRVLGPEGMARSVIVAATSDRSAALRRRCASAAMAIAEHFRDAGRHVLLLTDSITRLADAHREIALAAGEPASLRGHPPSMAAQITALCERAGPGQDDQGDITAIFTVLVAGSDMEEPVADVLRGVLDGHVVLDRSIAERGRFPAVDLLKSVSRSLPLAASEQENLLIGEARRLLGAYEKSEMMIQAGLYAPGSDPTVDMAITAWPKLDAFIGQSEPQGIRESFASLARCLSRRTGTAET